MQSNSLRNTLTDGDNGAGFIHRSGAVPSPKPGCLGDVLALLGGEPDPRVAIASVPLWRVPKDAALYAAGAVASAIYVVRTGSFKCVHSGEDGYEQVLGFAAPRDALGFEGLAIGWQAHAAVALEDSSVLALPLSELQAWRGESPALDRALQRTLSSQLARIGQTASLMAPVAAEARVARFLVWLSAWMAARGQSPRNLLLRMSRRDIASLLGVAHETVSRCLTQFSESGWLAVLGREIRILDLEALDDCGGRTRRETDRACARPAPAALAA